MLWWLPLAALAAPRPPSAAWEDHGVLPVRCHAERPADTYRCQDVFKLYDLVWPVAFEELGLELPLADGELGGSDALDVYLTYEPEGADTFAVPCDGEPDCADADLADGRYGASAFVVLDVRTDGPTLRRLLPVALARASWMGVDAAETAPPFVVATSTMMGQRLLGEAPAPPVPAVVDYQTFPWASSLLHGTAFLYEEHGFWTDYDSGAWLWMASVEGYAGWSRSDELWATAAQDGPVNEPDALEAWSRATSTAWEDQLLAFAAERAQVGTDRAPAWLRQNEPAMRAWREAHVALPAAVEPAYPPYPLGMSMWDTLVTAGVTLSVDLESEVDTRWAFVFVDPTGVISYRRSEPGVPGLHAEYTTGDLGLLTVIVVNLGAEGFDADDPLEPAPYTLTLRPYSAEEAEDPEPTRGTCGCSGGLGSVSMLLLAPWALRRRQRPPQPRSLGSSLP